MSAFTSTNIHSVSSDAYIVFFPYRTEETRLGTGFDQSFLATKQIPVKKEILSISTSKGKGGAGSWRVILGSSQNYKSFLHPGCWCMIHMSSEPLTTFAPNSLEDGGLKMLGIVRSVRAIESLDEERGTRTVRYEVSGDDFHAVMDTQVYINQILRPSGNQKTNPVIDSLVLFKRDFSEPQPPESMVAALIKAVLGSTTTLDQALVDKGALAGGVYGVPPEVARALTGKGNPGNKFVSILGMFLQKGLLGRIVPQPQLGTLFSLWSMIQQYSHRILNECYTDLFPTAGAGQVRIRPGVVLRPIPFSGGDAPSGVPTLKITKARSNRLIRDITPGKGNQFYRSRDIYDHEIISMNYGKSDGERFNFFYISPNVAKDYGLAVRNIDKLIERTGGINQMGDANSLARNGIRPYIANSDYVLISDDDVAKVNLTVRDLWSKAYLYENGTVTIIGTKEHIPVGTNITFHDRKWIAHVERVSHTYSVGQNGKKTYRTTINFVRLQTVQGSPIDLVEKSSVRGDFDRGVTHSTGGER